MADHSAIEWTEATWNPVTGCTKVSPGCDHCYAERITERFHGKGSFAVVQRSEDKLYLPLRWRKPRRIFVNSMSDLFHDDVPASFIARVFSVMAQTPQHTYQILTKRHGRMRAALNVVGFLRQLVGDVTDAWPLPNVWLGVSVEDQQWADIRIPALLETPAAVRWLSCEPLLGPIDLSAWLPVACAQLGEDGTGEVAFHNEQAVERSEERLDIANARNLPGSDRLPTVSDGSVVIPTNTTTGHRVAQPVDQFGRGAVDGDDRTVLPVGPTSPLQVALAVEKASNVAQRRAIHGHGDAGGPQPLTLSADRYTGSVDTPSHRLARDGKLGPDDREGLPAVVGEHEIINGRRHRRESTQTPGLHWIVVGGESGPDARPMHPDWARSLRDQCTAAQVPFFFKQWGEWAPNGWRGIGATSYISRGRERQVGDPIDDLGHREIIERVGKKAAGRLLDGELHDAYPVDVTP